MMVAAIAFIFVVGSATAFVQPSIVVGKTGSASLNKAAIQQQSNVKDPLYILPPEGITDIPYGEESRKFRRTVYTHDDWVKHRNPNRFFKNLRTTTTSGIYKNVGREVVFVTIMAIFVMLWNMLTGEYTDLIGGVHPGIVQSQFAPTLALPMNPFTLSSSFLGLLLVFRTNKAYTRWDEARKNWGMNINHTRDLVRMGTTFYDNAQSTDEQRDIDLQRLSLCTWAFVRSMKRHLSPEWEDEIDFKNELFQRLPAMQAQSILDAAHRPNRALYDLSLAIEQLPMHFIRKDEMHKALTIFEDNLGSSERLLTSPIPVFYIRHVARFLFVWLSLLPFALYEPCKESWNHVMMVPISAVISLFLFGIEELATQMEEPFTILPMQAFCDKIGNWCNEIVSWKEGDNGVYNNNKLGTSENGDTSFLSSRGHNSVYFESEL